VKFSGEVRIKYRRSWGYTIGKVQVPRLFLEYGHEQDSLRGDRDLEEPEITQGFGAVRFGREVMQISIVAEKKELDLAGADHDGQAPQFGEV
jgi:hypothetical protein